MSCTVVPHHLPLLVVFEACPCFCCVHTHICTVQALRVINPQHCVFGPNGALPRNYAELYVSMDVLAL